MLAATTTLCGILGFVTLGRLMQDDAEDEAQSDALQATIACVRMWMLSSAIVGLLAARGTLKVCLQDLVRSIIYRSALFIDEADEIVASLSTKLTLFHNSLLHRLTFHRSASLHFTQSSMLSAQVSSYSSLPSSHSRARFRVVSDTQSASTSRGVMLGVSLLLLEVVWRCAKTGGTME